VFVVRIDGLEPLTGRCSQMKGISAAQENAARERPINAGHASQSLLREREP
jgi:hypothetical protein